MPRPKNHEFHFWGHWAYGEEAEISRLIDGLDDAISGLDGGTAWWPSTFETFSNAEALRGVISTEIHRGHLRAEQLYHRVLGHMPATWMLDDFLVLIQSKDRETLDGYADLIGAETVGTDGLTYGLGFDGLNLGPNAGLYGAIIYDLKTELAIRPDDVWLAFHGEYRCPRPLFGFPEPVDAEEDMR